MGPTRCKNCGKEVISNAKSCPHCGAPVWVATCLMNTVKMTLLIVAAVVATWLCRQLWQEILPFLRAWRHGGE